MSYEQDCARCAAFATAVWQLPGPQREAFLLVARDALPYPVAAGRLDISVARLEHLLAAALVSLDRELP